MPQSPSLDPFPAPGVNPRYLLLQLLLLACSLVMASPVSAAKTDVVVFENGDRLTGEVKGLERGMLSFKTDPTDKISVKWTDVWHISTDSFLEIETVGEKYFGTLVALARPRFVGLVGVMGTDTLAVSMVEVVFITPIKKTFWSRIDGNIDLGFTYTQSSSLIQMTLNVGASYRGTHALVSSELNSQVSKTEGITTTNRHDLTNRLQYFLPHKWLVGGSLAFTKNDQLGIDLRIQYLGMAGYYLTQKNSILWSASGGLALSQEIPTGGTDFDANLEAALSTAFTWFTYNTPKRDVEIYLAIYPNLTTQDESEVTSAPRSAGK